MKKGLLFSGAVAIVVSALAVVGLSTTAATDEYKFLARGLVIIGGDDLNVYFTHASGQADPDLSGIRNDISVSTAKIYKWTKDSSGKLVKKRVKSSSLVPGQEVVVNGVKKSNGVFVASWVVINDRSFTINGKLKAVERDAGKTDEGWITVEVGNSTYKQSQIVDKDVRMRINGTTKLSALGNVKLLDEVTANSQSVRVKGEVINSNHYAVSQFNEL